MNEVAEPKRHDHELKCSRLPLLVLRQLEQSLAPTDEFFVGGPLPRRGAAVVA